MAWHLSQITGTEEDETTKRFHIELKYYAPPTYKNIVIGLPIEEATEEDLNEAVVDFISKLNPSGEIE